MSKFTKVSLSGGLGSQSTITQNFDNLETFSDNTISRDGTTPNAMEANFDMGDNNIINVKDANDNSHAVPYGQLKNYVIANAQNLIARVSDFQTATEGQTVFTLPFDYTVGVDNLSVYVNGVLLNRAGGYYTETDSRTVTLTNPLPLGAEVIFFANDSVSTLVANADNTSVSDISGSLSLQNLHDRAKKYFFETLTGLTASSVSGIDVSDTIVVSGYAAAGDSGSAEWKCTSTTATGGTAGFSSAGLYRIDNGDSTFSEFQHMGNTLNAESVGVVADGTTDNTAAITSVLYVNKPTAWPKGVILFNTSPADEVTVYEGLDWFGVNRGLTDSPSSSETVLRYAGTDTAFYFLEDDGVNSVGGMSFSKMTIECTQSGASAFRFNNESEAPTDDATTPNYIRQIQFKSVSLRGAKGAGSRGISATKTFELTTDANCEVRGFERGVYLYGSDNCDINGRFQLNGRNIQIDRVNTFGNDNKISARFAGTPDTNFTSETRYNIYDNGNHTIILGIELENVTVSSSTLMYINGSGCRYYGIDFSTNTNAPYELGPGAKDVASFGAKTTGTLDEPIIQAPTEIDRPVTLSYPGITFYGASQRFLDRIGSPLRTRVGETESATVSGPLSRLGRERFTSNGVAMSHFTLGAYNYYGQSTGLGWTEPTLVADSDSYNGSAIQLESTSLRGFALGLEVGKMINNGDTVKITVQYKMSGTPASGSFRWYRGINGTISSNAALTNSTSYTTREIDYTLSGFSDGDLFRFGCYNSSVTDETCNISVIKIQIVEPAVDDLNQTISGTYSQSEVQAISDKVDATLAALRGAGVIGD